MKAVAADLLEVLDPVEPAADRRSRARRSRRRRSGRPSARGSRTRARPSTARRRPSFSSSTLGQLDEVVVRHRPQVVADEAEVLEADAGLVGVGDHPGRPGAEVLDAADPHVRLVDVDPVVREEIFAVDDQRDREEVAIAQAERGVDRPPAAGCGSAISTTSRSGRRRDRRRRQVENVSPLATVTSVDAPVRRSHPLDPGARGAPRRPGRRSPRSSRPTSGPGRSADSGTRRSGS